MADISRNGFTEKKYAKQFPDGADAIIIGSGMAGLASAAMLSLAGWKVALLEQHDVIGGTTHAFVEKKKWEFDTGLHYVGEMMAKNPVLALISDGSLEWSKLDREFDHAVMDNTLDGDLETVKMCEGRTDLINALSRQFPAEKSAIASYFFWMKVWAAVGVTPLVVAKQLPSTAVLGALFTTLAAVLIAIFWGITLTLLLVSALVGACFSQALPACLWSLHDYMAKFTTMDVMKQCGLSDKLVGVLTYNYADFGTLPSQAPFLVQSAHIDHWFDGAYYPRGGCSRIAHSIIPTITEAQGACFVRAPVESILLDSSGSRATGVRVKGVDCHAPVVISAAGAHTTFTKLLSTDTPLPTEVKLLQKHLLSPGPALSGTTGSPSVSMLSLFVGIEGDSTELGLPSYNTWVFPSWDHESNMAAHKAHPTDARFAAGFIVFPSSKDQDWASRWPGASVAEVLVPVLPDIFSQWKETRIHSRGAEYDALKAAFSQRMLKELLYRHFPQLEGKVVYHELGTSLSNDFYYGTSSGEVYGLDHCMSRFSSSMQCLLKPKTAVAGLYISGQDTLLNGIMGAMMSGAITTFAVSKVAFLKIPASCLMSWLGSATRTAAKTKPA